MAERYGPSKWQWSLSKRNYSFETQIDEIVVNTQARLLAVMRTAIKQTVEDAQLSDDYGGRMRIDTGFLRWTGLSSLKGIPSGPGRGEKDKTYIWNGDALNITLAKMKIGDTFYFGWTANYAKYREAYDGFLEAALQNWQTNVNAVVNKFKGKSAP